VKSQSPSIPAVTVTRAILIFALAALSLPAARTAAAQEKQLFSFTYAEGEEPSSDLLLDAKGNLYGAARGGGPHGFGDVFELIHEINGSWTFKILHAFGAVIEGSSDGGQLRSDLTWGPDGSIFGTTYGGGKHGQGTVFELLPESNGQWTEKILYNFGSVPQDGTEPYGGVVRGANGHLYGTTYSGGKDFRGTVFELIPSASGQWTEKTLHSFQSENDGYAPIGNLALDAQGHLYGANFLGGKNLVGAVFELTPQASGSWTEKVIYNFGTPADGPASPLAGLIFDAKGNLYGTSTMGGQSSGDSCSCGTVFELSPQANKTWKEKTLYSFKMAFTDGNAPKSALHFDSKGNLYGTTDAGGPHSTGTVFELSPAAGGLWTEKILYSFGSTTTDGYSPIAGVTPDSAGNLYGTTFAGGTDRYYGTVFEIVHPKAAAETEDDADATDSLPE
jgi:uncharacterized repeat protein (TIGR03803 family)